MALKHVACSVTKLQQKECGCITRLTVPTHSTIQWYVSENETILPTLNAASITSKCHTANIRIMVTVLLPSNL